MFFKKQFAGSVIDKFIRLFFNFFSKIYFKISKAINDEENRSFVFISYGGLGDCILTFPFLIELSFKYHVSIFLDEKLGNLNYLFNENIQVIYYKKKYLLKELKKFSILRSNYILIQQTPIMEFMLFHYYLKRPSTIGFIYKQNIISFEGIKKKDIALLTNNKSIKYKELLAQILLFENKSINDCKNNYINKEVHQFKYKDTPKRDYFILSTTKDHNWEMGFLNYETYGKFLINLSKKSNILPVLVGTINDINSIQNILQYLPENLKVLNLVGKTTIKDLMSLIINSNFVIANDNGVHHLSNFLKKQTLTLYNFSSHEVYNWTNKTSNYIFNQKFNCMPCVGNQNGPFDNYPFKCPWQVRCKNTISENDIIKKLEDLNWIN